MDRTTVVMCVFARSCLSGVSLQARPVAWLGALLLAASLPAGSLASVPGTSGGSQQQGPSVRAARASTGAPNIATGRGRRLVLQVRGSG